MISVSPTITDAGKNLLLRAIAGEQIIFTQFKIGNGELGETKIADMEELLNPLVSFDINEIDTSEKGFVKLTGKFDSTYIKTDFRWTELGVFCKGEDDKEVLYAYSADGENAGMLKANATDVVTEQTVALVIAVGDAENVTAILSDSVLYASKSEFEEHVSNKENPHGITAEHIGLGKVPNVSTNNQTPTYTMPTSEEEMQSGEKMSVAFGKIARVVKSFIAHIKNTDNPHKITAKKIKAAESEHTHTTADITSGILSVERGGTGVKSIEELKKLLGIEESNVGMGFYIGNGSNNQFVNLGFKPKSVSISCPGNSDEDYNASAVDGKNALSSNYKRDYSTTDVSKNPTNSDYKHSIKLAIVDDGFYVYYCSASGHPKMNVSGKNYIYYYQK